LIFEASNAQRDRNFAASRYHVEAAMKPANTPVKENNSLIRPVKTPLIRQKHKIDKIAKSNRFIILLFLMQAISLT